MFSVVNIIYINLIKIDFYTHFKNLHQYNHKRTLKILDYSLINNIQILFFRFFLNSQQRSERTAKVMISKIIKERINHRARVAYPEQGVLHDRIVHKTFCTDEIFLPAECQAEKEKYPT